MTPSQDLLEAVCSLWLPVTHRDVVGVTPQGLRSAGYLDEGRVEGARLNGAVLKGGADWCVVRRDGIMEVDVKFMIQTNDEAMIQVTYTGVVDFGEDGFERAVQGQPPAVKPSPRTAPRMLTSHPKYAWVNRSQFVAYGEIDYAAPKPTVRYDVYRMR